MAGRYSGNRSSQARRQSDDGLSLSMSILIVNSAPHELAVLHTILSGEQGWKIVIAQSGAEALQALAKGDVDLVLADLVLPACCGLELCRSIKNCPDTRDTPVVILLTGTGYLDQTFEAGA